MKLQRESPHSLLSAAALGADPDQRISDESEVRIMPEPSDESVYISAPQKDLDYEQARLAYSIIESLIEHTRVVSDLIALMAQVLDEETTKAVTLTPTWTAYLDSRRAMEKTKAEVEKFAEVLKQVNPDS